MNSNELEQTAQDPKSRTETGQRLELSGNSREAQRLPKDHENYWSAKLTQRTYRTKSGNIETIPELQVRLIHANREAWFNLATKNKSEAAKKARDIYLFLRANGWEKTLEKFKRPTIAAKEAITIAQFREIYREALRVVEYPPSPQTASRYLQSLELICRRERVNRIADLTGDMVRKFKADYRSDGREQGRKEASIQTSCNALLRNAAALFSRQMRAEYAQRGLALPNPFEGTKFRRIEMQTYNPMSRDLLNAIWSESVMLRDGNPDAPERIRIKTGGRKAKLPPGQKSKRWREPDFRQPQPGAYVILLLELGLGLRRNEADKAQWDWFSTDAHGRHYLTVQSTSFFTPKSKKSRIIPVEKLLFEAIQATREQVSPFVVPGLLPKQYEAGQEPKNLAYRCEPHHRALATWLRKHGVKDAKPCHTLRKEFGSYVATAFGLFHAQRMLGHSSPDVTSAFYAGLTGLPELSHAQIK